MAEIELSKKPRSAHVDGSHDAERSTMAEIELSKKPSPLRWVGIGGHLEQNNYGRHFLIPKFGP